MYCMMKYLWIFLDFLYRKISCKKENQPAILNDAFDETNTGYILCDV